MNEIISNISNGIKTTSIWEWLAVGTSVFYVILISFKQLSAWIFAALSSVIYMYLCYTSKLYLETGLQIFYFLMAVYGWYMWTSDDDTKDVEVIQWPPKYHIINLIISTIAMLFFGYVFDNYTSQANPYVDSFTTIFSLAATFMVAKKVLENWIYWIVIDAASVYLFAGRNLYLTSVLFVIYTSIAIFGYIKWRKQFIANSL